MPNNDEPPDSPCLTDDLLAVLIDGRLTPEKLSRVHDHTEKCPDCHALLMAVIRGGLHQEDSSTRLVTGARSLLLPETPPGASSVGWTPPNEFGEFRLVRPLGRGAMGVVYLAHDRSLDRHVAVKFIAAHQPTAQVRARFQTEAQAIARLKQPNVVTVFRVGEVEGRPYIVSEYLEGRSLAELPLPLPWRRALHLGIGLARGLAEAHRQGVLHRDIKPANVLLTAQDEVKLLDFGLAELVQAETLPGTNRVHSVVGTPRYMAPELFGGTGATPRSDVYSLGLVLYELSTGELPRHRRDPYLPTGGQGASRLAEQPGPGEGSPLSARVPGIDPDFATIIERCLRIDPEERFASAEALLAALEPLEQPHEVEVLPSGNPYRGLEPFEAEHRALFFGRDSDIRAVLERLRHQPLVLVAGDSGVGKSSLCRAGLLPRVLQGALDESRDFKSLTLTPGRRPLAALAAALAPILRQPEAELGARLAETPEVLGPALREAHQEWGGLLLFVDQLEELVTLSEPGQAECFARLLGELSLPTEGVRVLLAVRGDFLTRVGALPGLGGVVERALYLLQPLTPEGVREAIVGPARGRGVVFESEALRQTLAGATARGSGSLPLLQFALAELWERRDSIRNSITRAALEAMGGVAGALSRHADGVLASLEPAQQQAARRLLGRLITAEGTRGERSEEELAATSEEARAALRTLVQGRLLHARTVGGRASYEIAHEALIASWGTLRRWLDEDVGQRALQQRIEAASAEWERLGRAEELLWRKRQLDDARELAVDSLGAREQDFLKASQRAVRRQRLRLGVALLLLMLGVGGFSLWSRLREYQEIQSLVAAAQVALSKGRELGQRATVTREKALALFNGQTSSDPGAKPSFADLWQHADQSLVAAAQFAFSKGRELSQRATVTRGEALVLFIGQTSSGPGAKPSSADLWQRAEDFWEAALDGIEQADVEFGKAERFIEDALELSHEDSGARQLLIDLTYERIMLAERFHRKDERDRLLQDFERLTAKDPAWRERLLTPAGLELTTEPSGARVELMRYVEDKGVLRREPVPGLGALGPTPITRVTLPAGSYHLRITHEGRVPVELPLLLERGGHERVHVALPATVPEGYVYVPPGCFLSGSADPEAVRKFLRSAPLGRNCLQEGFFIGRNEVTLGDWLEYLQTLPEGAPEGRILETGSAGSVDELSLRQLPDRTWSFSLKLVSEHVLTARAGEPIRYPGRKHRQEQDWRRFPLAGVSAEDVTGYLAWLDRTGRLPGARLCNELEWTRAARGADGRRYPHGDWLQKDDADIEWTYGRRPDGFGPDEVGSHPASASPFGIQDLAGNAFEITRPMTSDLSQIVLRGGAWYYDESGALIANRQVGTIKLRDARVGVRVCASLPPSKVEDSTMPE